MKTKTQEQIVLEQLHKKGYVSRNWCLTRFISRLGGIAWTLLHVDGYSLKGYWGRNITNRKDGDYYYVLDDFIKDNEDGTFTLINTK